MDETGSYKDHNTDLVTASNDARSLDVEASMGNSPPRHHRQPSVGSHGVTPPARGRNGPATEGHGMNHFPAVAAGNNSNTNQALVDNGADGPPQPGAFRIRGPDYVSSASSSSRSASTRASQGPNRQDENDELDELVDAEWEEVFVPEARLVESGEGEQTMPRWLTLLLLCLTLAVLVGITLGVVATTTGGGGDVEDNDPQPSPTLPGPTTTSPSPSAPPSPATEAPTKCNGCWVQTGNSILGKVQNARSGEATALSADGLVLAIGEPGVDQVRVFEWKSSDDGGADDGEWLQRGDPLPGPPGSSFGSSVAISDDGRTVASGGPTWGYSNHVGLVRIYRWLLPHRKWHLLHESFGSAAKYGNWLGADVALSSTGRSMVVTGPYWDMYIYLMVSKNSELDALGEWRTLSSYDGFGSPERVFLSGDGTTLLASDTKARAIVGEPINSTHWKLKGSELTGSFPFISMDAKFLIMGSPLDRSVTTVPDDIETSLYKWDDTSSNWSSIGESLPGYPIAFSADGSIVAIATANQTLLDFDSYRIVVAKPPARVNVYYRSVDQHDNEEGSWRRLGEEITFNETFLVSSVSREIITTPSPSDGGLIIKMAIGSNETSLAGQGKTTVFGLFVNDSSLDLSIIANNNKPAIPFLQCENGFMSVRFELKTDLAASEEDISWEIAPTVKNYGDEHRITLDAILQGGNYSEPFVTHVAEACLPKDTCYHLGVHDYYQEGICCAHGEAGYILYLDGKVFATTEPSDDVPYGLYSHRFGSCDEESR